MSKLRGAAPASLIPDLHYTKKRHLARAISIVENEAKGYQELLQGLKPAAVPVIGITGPPGAGKSTLINELINTLTAEGKAVGVIAVDPTSPFTQGSLLGDRIRMTEHYANPNVYIRSLATRGSLGGLSAKAVEVVDVMKSAGFDYILVETVGVGQSEVEVVSLADTVVVVLVPEAGDEVQVIKSGLMEIADVFAVNKADRPGAHTFLGNLKKLLRTHGGGDEWRVPVVPTTASTGEGIEKLVNSIRQHQEHPQQRKKLFLLAEKAYRLIQQERMRDVSRKELQQRLEQESGQEGFNLYTFIQQWGVQNKD